MAIEQNLVCFNTFGSDESWSLATYEQHDGYQAWRKILAEKTAPEEIIDTIKGSNPNDTDIELRFMGDSSWALFIGKSQVWRACRADPSNG